MSKQKSYFKLREDEEESSKLISDDDFKDVNSNLHSLEKEGSATSSSKLSRRQIIALASFLGVAILVVVTVSVAVTGKNESEGTTGGKPKITRSSSRQFSLTDVLSGIYGYDTYQTDWISDNSYLHRRDSYIREYDMDTVKWKYVILPEEGREMNIERVREMSPDKKWFLFANNTKGLYRHSFYGDYYVKNIETSEIKKIKATDIDGDSAEQIRYCGWSTARNALVFVYKCNIYYVPSVGENPMNFTKITNDGVPKKIFNGVPDWVYEEEIIASTHAIEFSNDGKYMSYVNFNASAVPFFKFPIYGELSSLYTTIDKIAYPKAGFPNPTVKINVVNLEDIVNNNTKLRRELVPPAEISSGYYFNECFTRDFYYTVMKWNQNKVFVQWMNRHQNNTICVLYEFDKDNKGVVVEKHTTPNGWIDDDYVKPYFSKNGDYYITMLPKSIIGMGDYRHLAKVKLTSSGGQIEYLTDGPFTVQDINCYNEEEEIVYFRSTEANTRFRHVYKLELKTLTKTCFSCGKIEDSGVNCTYYYPQFSKSCSWVTLMCQGPFVPVTHMVSTRNDQQYALTYNNKTKEILAEKDVPVNVYYTVESDGFQIPIRETRPKNFDESKKYAVLFDVYGGPNTQKVTDRFSINFDYYFVTMHDIILITCDARGTGYRGYNYLYAVYRNLGYYETIDAINVARKLKEKSYVDPERMAIWGWSYGGFYSATVLATAEDTFTTAVAVAPVTDWRYYDTVYSERYMGLPTPEDNLAGYERTSVMSKAKKFAGKNFLLMHGTADDNVHFQNTAQLAKALIRERIKFRSQFYPDKDHGIQTRGYVYLMIADYLVAHLKGTGIKTGFRRYFPDPDNAGISKFLS